MRFTSILFAGVKVEVRGSILRGGGLGSFLLLFTAINFSLVMII
jgi:hypothetical protein